MKKQAKADLTHAILPARSQSITHKSLFTRRPPARTCPLEQVGRRAPLVVHASEVACRKPLNAGRSGQSALSLDAGELAGLRIDGKADDLAGGSI